MRARTRLPAIRLEVNIGCLVSGAGLAMAAMDSTMLCVVVQDDSVATDGGARADEGGAGLR